MTPLLPLDTFRAIMGMHPYHFWQLANGTVPVSAECSDVTYQYAWQNAQAASREDILQAIETAETRLREFLGYGVAPRYVVETLTWPQYAATGLHAHGNAAVDGKWYTVQLGEGEIRAIGTELLTLIGNAAIVYSDADGDGVNETFTCTIATTVTDASQIAAYFVAADRLDTQPVGDRWRIQPIQVAISGGTATIIGRSWLLVKPIKYQGVAVTTLDPATASNLATDLAIYQRTTDTTAQATLIWDTLPYPWYCYANSPTIGSPADPAATGTATGRVGISDARRGIVHPAEATYNATDGTWSASLCCASRTPDRVTVRYLAGAALGADHQMDYAWQVVVARLAAAELGRPICACQGANRELYRWQFDLARTGGANDESYGAINADDLDNPLGGTRRGHIYAWRHIRQLRQQRGLFVG